MDCPLDGRFEIGSMTKTMTGAVLASLVNDGTAGFGDPIGRWLDAGQNSDVTLLQLATHTSGLPPNARSHRWCGRPVRVLDRRGGRTRAAADPAKPRGVEWDYSSFGFQVLSLALERATGTAFGSLLERHVFRPLGMACSGVAGRGRGAGCGATRGAGPSPGGRTISGVPAALRPAPRTWPATCRRA